MHLIGAGAKPARILVVALAVLIAACDYTPDQGATPTPNPAAGFPLTVRDGSGASVTIKAQPQRIVSLSPTATEMLFAIGAGSQVVAVDDQSNYPANAPTTKLSGFQPNIEAIAAYKPDLVVAADDTGSLVHGMTDLSVPTLIEPAAKNLDDSYAPPLTVYHELDDTYYSATSSTFIGQIYKLLGLENIADKAKGAASDYPQLSSEYIVSANPDLIVLADTKCCHQDAQTVAARPGWNHIRAVRSGYVIGVDDDVASRWGPRIAEFVLIIALRLKQLETNF